MGEGGVDATLIVNAAPGRCAGHLNRGHAIDSIGRQHRRKSDAGETGQIGRLDLRGAVDAKVARPNNLGGQSPVIFERRILHSKRCVRNPAVVTSAIAAIGKDGGSRVVAVEPAVAAVDAMAVRNLVIEFDIKLVVGIMRKSIHTVIEEFSRQIWLRVKVDNCLPDGIDFTRRDDVQDSVILHLIPGRTVRTARDGIEYWILGGGKIPGSLGQRGHRSDNVNGFVVANPFEVSEEKRAVLA